MPHMFALNLSPKDRFDQQEWIELGWRPSQSMNVLKRFFSAVVDGPIYGGEDSRTIVSLVVGPVGSGKTQTTVYSFINLGMKMPVYKGRRRSVVQVVRLNNDTVDETLVPTFNRVLEMSVEPDVQLGEWKGDKEGRELHLNKWRYKERSAKDGTGWRPIYLEDGTQLDIVFRFSGLWTPGQVKSLYGKEFSHVWYNECNQVAYEHIARSMGRAGREPTQAFGKYTPRVVMDCNSTPYDNWVGKIRRGALMGEATQGLGFEVMKFIQPGVCYEKSPGKWALTPKHKWENWENLSPGYYEGQLASYMESNPDLVRTLLANQTGTDYSKDRVFSRFQEYKNVSEVVTWDRNGGPVAFGIDPGKAGACVMAQFSADMKQIRVIDEYAWDDKYSEETSQYIKAKINMVRDVYRMGEVYVFGDMAGSSTTHVIEHSVWQAYANNGVTVTPIPFNDLHRRLGAVTARLDEEIPMESGNSKYGLVIGRKCNQLIKAMSSGYIWNAAEGARIPDKKQFASHIADALQYLVLGMNTIAKNAREIEERKEQQDGYTENTDNYSWDRVQESIYDEM